MFAKSFSACFIVIPSGSFNQRNFGFPSRPAAKHALYLANPRRTPPASASISKIAVISQSISLSFHDPGILSGCSSMSMRSPLPVIMNRRAIAPFLHFGWLLMTCSAALLLKVSPNPPSGLAMSE